MKHFSLKQILGFYNQKYQDGSEFLVLKSLSYFDDADSDENPMMLKVENWDSIKAFIKKTVKNYTKKSA